MKNKIILAALLMSSTAAFAGPAYIGGTLGSASQKLNIQRFSVSEDSTSAKLFGGYQFTKHIGVEAGYIHFGKADFQIEDVRFNTKSKSAYVALTGAMPVSSDFDITAKIGVGRNKSTVTGTDEDGTESFSRNATSAMFGVGVAYKFTDNMSLVAEYENYGKVGKMKEADLNVKASTVSAGLRISF